jgi:hypothetical protein
MFSIFYQPSPPIVFFNGERPFGISSSTSPTADSVCAGNEDFPFQ